MKLYEGGRPIGSALGKVDAGRGHLSTRDAPRGAARRLAFCDGSHTLGQSKLVDDSAAERTGRTCLGLQHNNEQK